MKCRGIKGATTASGNTEREILSATRELILRLVEANAVAKEDVAAVFFTCTPDLDAAFPARTARELGYTDVPLMCGREMAVPGALKSCIRVLLLVNTDLRQNEVKHLYLRGAKMLRPELAADP